MNKYIIQLIEITIYRFDKCVVTLSNDFLNLQLENGCRTPKEIIKHLVDVTNYGISILEIKNEMKVDNECTYIRSNLTQIITFSVQNEISDIQKIQLINGPLSDTLTHIGQLAILRRVLGNPIDWEDYTNAKTMNYGI